MDFDRGNSPQRQESVDDSVSIRRTARRASLGSAQLDQLAVDISDSREQHTIHNQTLPELRIYVEGNPHRRCQLQQCGFVPTLMSCVRTAPDSDSRRTVLELLREVVTDLAVYPKGITDSHYSDLTISLNEVQESVVECLEILRELTRFSEAQHAVVSNGIHSMLAKIISFLHYQEVLIPAIEILVNVSAERFRCQTVLRAGIFNAFKKAAGNCLLLHHQRRGFQEAQANGEVFKWMTKFQMVIDERDQQEVLQSIIRKCEHFCSEVLSEWTGVMIQWSRFMEVCTKYDEVIPKAIELGFLENSQVIIRYGETNSLATLIQALANVSAKSKESYNRGIIDVGLIRTILDRFPVHELGRVTLMSDAQARSFLDLKTVENIFRIIDNVLTSVLEGSADREYKRTIIEFLLERNIMTTPRLFEGSAESQRLLGRITGKLNWLP
ncbi:uncharacterized protein LOC114828354 [Galendromus occidentalis]|uniref:Uncharacterized protein LOC114828354 n=1 Tax=Galendromus occidentalis TaxID=34638 RepID=A0AAJ7WI70_9ACAR|nr:uncharacterized protein LOC114828354 [Galendromus occidentalis]